MTWSSQAGSALPQCPEHTVRCIVALQPTPPAPPSFLPSFYHVRSALTATQLPLWTRGLQHGGDHWEAAPPTAAPQAAA